MWAGGLRVALTGCGGLLGLLWAEGSEREDRCMARLVTSGEARSAARCFPCAEGARCVTGGPEPSSVLLRVAVSCLRLLVAGCRAGVET